MCIRFLNQTAGKTVKLMFSKFGFRPIVYKTGDITKGIVAL